MSFNRTEIHNQILLAGDKIRANKAQCFWFHFTCANKFPGHLSFDYDDVNGLMTTMLAYENKGLENFRVEAGMWEDFEERC
jgi:hypothetical protein